MTAPTITSPRLRGEVGSRGCRVRESFRPICGCCAVAKMPLTPALSPQAGRRGIPPLCSTNALLHIFANLRNVVLARERNSAGSGPSDPNRRKHPIRALVCPLGRYRPYSFTICSISRNTGAGQENSYGGAKLVDLRKNCRGKHPTRQLPPGRPVPAFPVHGDVR